MKTFSLMLAFIVVGVCLGAEQKPASTAKDKVPTYEGKTLSEWIALSKDEDEAVRRDVASALKNFRPQAKIAVPILAELLKDKNKDVRLTATEALGSIGSEAEIAVDGLIESLKSKSTHWNDAPTSGNFGPRRRSPFLPWLSCSRTRIRTFG